MEIECVLQIHEIIKPPSGWHMWMLGYLVSEGAWRTCRTFRTRWMNCDCDLTYDSAKKMKRG
jgi:hypothetical protein